MFIKSVCVCMLTKLSKGTLNCIYIVQIKIKDGQIRDKFK